VGKLRRYPHSQGWPKAAFCPSTFPTRWIILNSIHEGNVSSHLLRIPRDTSTSQATRWWSFVSTSLCSRSAPILPIWRQGRLHPATRNAAPQPSWSSGDRNSVEAVLSSNLALEGDAWRSLSFKAEVVAFTPTACWPILPSLPVQESG